MTDESRESVPVLLRRTVAAGLIGSSLGISILAFGSKSDKILGVLSVGLAVATPFFDRLLDVWLPGEWHFPRDWRVWAYIVTIAVVCGPVGVLTWRLWHKTDENVTDQVRVVGGATMKDRDIARLTFPNPHKRGWLALIPRLVSKTPSGMCVDRVQLMMRPVVDGVAEPQHVARPGTEARLHLGQVQRSVYVDVVVSVPDQGCVFALQVDEALFYNRRLPW
jgi:hypothetical protein